MIRYQEFADLATATKVRDAIDNKIGHPTRGTNVGADPHCNLDDGTYTGWTVHECDLLLAQDGSGTACLVVSDAAYALNGQSVTHPGPPIDVVTINLSSPVSTLPAKYINLSSMNVV